MKLELDAPEVGDIEKKQIAETIDSGFVSTYGPYVGKFEKEIAGYLNTDVTISTQSGTAAIHMALYELGIGRGDEVIVPSLTFVASVNPVLYVGAKPIFVDVDPLTWVMDPSKLESKITKKTKAIIPVHLYGNPCHMESIMKIADKNGVFVIEDATESLGAKFNNKHTGTFGDFGCFSFNGNKIITTGGGGMLTGRDAAKLAHIKFLINQARDEEQGYFHPELGFNYRMTNIESAMGIAQMKRVNGFLDKKKRFNRIYRDELKSLDNVRFQESYNMGESSWWLNCVYIDGDVDLKAIQKELKAREVPTRFVFMPVTEFPFYPGYDKNELASSYDIYKHSLCLPSSTLNTEEGIRYAAGVVKKVLLASS